MVFEWVVEVDLVSVYGPKITSFVYGGHENDVVFVWVAKIDLISVWDPIENGFFSVQGSELSWFLCGGRK